MRVYVIVILIFLSLKLFSQEVVYKQFSSKNGLISSYATQVIQDSEDYIWVSTNNGVMRFDGYSFENFNVNNHLPENDIVGLYKSEDKVIWFLSGSGLLSYYKEGEIQLYKYNDKVLSLLEDYNVIEPRSVIITDQYIELNIFEKGRFRIDNKGEVTTIFSLRNSVNIIDVRNKKNTYFICAQNEKLQILYKEETFLLQMPKVSHDDPVLIERHGDTLFLASQNNIFQLYRNTIKQFSYENAIYSLDIDINGNLWIGFKSGGVFCYKNSDLKDIPDCHELKGNSISSVIRDNQNSLWITSTNGGIFYLPSQNFKQVTTKDGLLDNNITRLDFSNNYLWAITGNNAIVRLSFYDIKNYEFSNEDFSTVTDIYWYNKRLWVSFKNKMSYFEGEELVDLFRLGSAYGSHSRINRINHGIGNDLWLSKSDGFVQVRNKQIIFESSVKNFQNLNVNGIIVEPNGSLWLGCKNGLWKFENNKLFNYNQDNPLLSANITDLVKDEKIGALWLAINGIGLVKILNDSIWSITKEDGLISNSVSSIYAQGNYLWVGTREGVSRIEINKGTKDSFTNITVKDGLISNEINDIVANEEFVFVATNNGLGFFSQEGYKPNTIVPQVRIEGIYIDGELVEEKNNVFVEFYSNNIKINYKAIHFRSRAQVEYRFRIEELDKEWNYTRTLNANYPFVPPGQYTFQVEASNESGVWSNKPTEIYINVGNPFWLEWWFFVILAIGFVALSYLLYRIFTLARRRKERVKREINEYRQMALTRQMNPHFIFNSLNAIQHYILQNDARLSSRFLTKFSKLIRFILENSQSSLISLDKELIALNLYLELEALRFKDKMQYTITIDPEIDIMNITIPPMLIQPFVENAVWHGIMNKEDGTTGLLEISFTYGKDSVTCTVSDNGIGRERANEINQKKNRTHNSMGTTITEDRIDLINSIYRKKILVKYDDPTDAHGNSKGTIVKLIFST